MPQGGEDVVGSNRRCAVRYDHCEYRTPTLLRGCYRNLSRSDGFSSVKAPQTRLHHPLDFDLVGRQECGNRCLCSIRSHIGEDKSPHAGLQPARQVALPHLDGIDNVESSRHRVIKVSAQLINIETRRKSNLDVLRLAGDTRWRRIGVGNLGMRSETRGIGHRNARTSQGPFKGTLKVSVT